MLFNSGRCEKSKQPPLRTRLFSVLSGIALYLSQTSPGFYVSFENTVGKGEIARNEQFLLFPKCFPPVKRTFCHFHQIRSCRLQTLSVWKNLKFVVWERITSAEFLAQSNKNEDVDRLYPYLKRSVP